jgi:hypothetical protein
MGCESDFFVVRRIRLFKMFQRPKTPIKIARLLGHLHLDPHRNYINCRILVGSSELRYGNVNNSVTSENPLGCLPVNAVVSL